MKVCLIGVNMFYKIYRLKTMYYVFAVLMTLISTVQGTPNSNNVIVNDHANQNSALLTNLANLDFSKLGHPALRWDHIPKVRAPEKNPHQLLVVLVRFPDVDFQRFKG